jgi:superfamily II DNA or RNA helicase
MIGLTGEMVFDVPERSLIRRGVIAQPKVCFVPCGGKKFWAKEWPDVNRKAVVENEVLTSLIASVANDFYVRGFKVLTLVWEKKHGHAIMRELRGKFGYEAPMFVGDKKVHVWDSGEIVEDSGKLERLAGIFDDSAPCIVLGTSVVGEGVDLPAANVLINGYSARGYRLAMQGPGRVLRAKAGDNAAFVIDIDHDCHPYLLSQSRKRREVYASVGYPIVTGVASLRSILARSTQIPTLVVGL